MALRSKRRRDDDTTATTNTTAKTDEQHESNERDEQQQHVTTCPPSPEASGDADASEPASSVACLRSTCVHEVVLPPSSSGGATRRVVSPGVPLTTTPAAKTYAFTLDPFQQTSIAAIEARENVLVAAHTSAGKTVVAEYAVACSLRASRRCVYTSPLKALSNQKYRELRDEFHDVGLLTGDVSVNPDASCLVMTTEVLRSMLYNGSDVVTGCEWIIFDEVHYLRDRERGVAWEESIVLAPKDARLVFLSATIPNASEFAGWVAKTHGTACHVVSTEYRPTPLQHFAFPAGGDKLYMTVDEKGRFLQSNFRRAIAELQRGAAAGSGKATAKSTNASTSASSVAQAKADARKSEKEAKANDMLKIVRLIMERGFDPVIVFSFSKRDCEALSVQMANLQLASDQEKKLIKGVFESAIDTLSDADRRLPQVTRILPLLLRGVGIHHGGMMPIVKEVTELLFQEGLLKVLFATETFSTGLNMPARTVVMTGIRKFDGTAFRIASPGEYIQMSGRAGRRGLDDRGIVILMLGEKMEPEAARGMMRGAPDPLNSAYHLTYHAMLNTMRAQSGLSPNELVRASFRQFQAEAAIPEARKRVDELAAQIEDSKVEGDVVVIADYVRCRRKLARLEADLRRRVFRAKHVLKFMQPGRLVQVLPEDWMAMYAASSEENTGNGTNESHDAAVTATAANTETAAGNGKVLVHVADDGSADSMQVKLACECPWATVVNFEKQGSKLKASGVRFMVDVLAPCIRTHNGAVRISPSEEEEEQQQTAAAATTTTQNGRTEGTARTSIMEVVSIPLDRIMSISTVRVYLPPDLRPKESRRRTADVVREVKRRYPKGVPCLDVEKDIKVDDTSVRLLMQKIDTAKATLESHAFALETDEARVAALNSYEAKQQLIMARRLVERQVVEAGELVMRTELASRAHVLRRLEYVDKEGMVKLKGHVAAEISSGDELVLTELMMDGSFSSMKPEEVAALLSCTIHEEKGGGNDKGKKTKPRAELERLNKMIRGTAKRIAETSLDCRLDVNRDEYVDRFRPEMMEMMFAWARGATFAELCKISDTYEGSIVRMIRRIEELLRQLTSAAEIMQERALVTLFEDTITRIRRDVVFAPNLYL